MAKPKRKTSKQTMASLADKYALYQESVQMPDHEVSFFLQAFSDERDREPHLLGEDFCGTFAVSCSWVRSSKKRTAIGIDNCPEALKWGREHNLCNLTDDQRDRVTLIEGDVRERRSPPVDILAVQNFSFWFFKTRKEVLGYFRSALSNLAGDGIVVIDMMGGAESQFEGLSHVQTIRGGKNGFKYQWKQVSFNPISSEACCSISFLFSDGSKLHDAFVYHWRQWTIIEVREILAEAGFSSSHVYWAIDGEIDADRDGGWARQENAPSDASWTCYLVAMK